MAAAASAIDIATHVHERAPVRRFYAPELDILRLFAFALVFMRHVVTGFGIARQEQMAGAAKDVGGKIAVPVAFHGHWSLIQDLAQSLDFGVCLFFFLSSYLITSLLLIEKSSTGTMDVRGFYIRRSLRIWPLYFAFLAAMAVFSYFAPWLNITRARMIASLLFVANWPVVLHGWAGSPIEPLWSVSVEEQFYLIWPHFARFGRSGVLAVSGVLATLPFLVLLWSGSRPHCENTEMWANSLVQCLFFAGGALTAALSGAEPRRRNGVERILLFVGGMVCWFVASVGCHVVRTVSPAPAALVAGYTLVLAGTFLTFLSCSGWRPARMPKGMLYLGKITYGLYVFHFLCLEVVTQLTGRLLAWYGAMAPSLLVLHTVGALLALGATIGCATISYSLLERPFLQLKKRFTIVPSRPG